MAGGNGGKAIFIAKDAHLFHKRPKFVPPALAPRGGVGDCLRLGTQRSGEAGRGQLGGLGGCRIVRQALDDLGQVHLGVQTLDLAVGQATGHRHHGRGGSRQRESGGEFGSAGEIAVCRVREKTFRPQILRLILKRKMRTAKIPENLAPQRIALQRVVTQ
jgi:hypothetical protein